MHFHQYFPNHEKVTNITAKTIKQKEKHHKNVWITKWETFKETSRYWHTSQFVVKRTTTNYWLLLLLLILLLWYYDFAMTFYNILFSSEILWKISKITKAPSVLRYLLNWLLQLDYYLYFHFSKRCNDITN